MYPFSFIKARDEAEALTAAAAGGRFIAGGTMLVDLMREAVERPRTLVDINALPYRQITINEAGLSVGALVKMSDLARDRQVRTQFPVLTQSLELSASAQLRNMASIGGNLMQRPRCPYFRDINASCNRRSPGAGCAAIEGVNRSHAVLGASEYCVATHPSDLAVALVALEAQVVLKSIAGVRKLPVGEFFRLPGDTPEWEHNLGRGELIVAVELPSGPHTARSGYLKVRDRHSYEFALVSAAVALHIDDGVVQTARVAVGGAGTIPWRLSQVEAALAGQAPSARLWQEAGALSIENAKPLLDNGFKIELMRRTVTRQLSLMGSGHV